MTESIGSVIARLRRERNLTQEQLGEALKVSYQAVSKWENEISCPDILNLPAIADFFGVSIDALFGREKQDLVPVQPAVKEEKNKLPWPDDDTLHAVVFVGHKLVDHKGGDRLFSRKQIEFCYKGPALHVQSDFDLRIDGDVQGSATAGGHLSCDNVYGDASARGDLTCDAVAGNVTAGGSVTCDDVAGNVSAGGNVACDDVGGSVMAASVDSDSEETVRNTFPGKKKGFNFDLKL